jgi:hypothetical protein
MLNGARFRLVMMPQRRTSHTPAIADAALEGGVTPPALLDPALRRR